MSSRPTCPTGNPLCFNLTPKMWQIDFPSPRMGGAENLKCKIDFPPPRMTCSENLFLRCHHGLGMVVQNSMGHPLEFQNPQIFPKISQFRDFKFWCHTLLVS